HIKLADKFPSLILVGRSTAKRRQRINSQRKKTFSSHPLCYVYNMWIQSPVFVDNDNPSNIGRSLWFSQNGFYFAIHTCISDIFSDYIITFKRLRGSIIVLQQRHHMHCGSCAAGK